MYHGARTRSPDKVLKDDLGLRDLHRITAQNAGTRFDAATVTAHHAEACLKVGPWTRCVCSVLCSSTCLFDHSVLV